MKAKITALLLILSFAASAQPDTAHTELTDYQHVMNIAYLPDDVRSQPEVAKYINFCSDSIQVRDSSGYKVLATPNKLLKYPAPVTLIEYLFIRTGSQPQRLVGSDNNRIQERLIGQWQTRRPDVLQRIGAIVQANAKDHEEIVQKNGTTYLFKLKN